MYHIITTHETVKDLLRWCVYLTRTNELLIHVQVQYTALPPLHSVLCSSVIIIHGNNIVIWVRAASFAINSRIRRPLRGQWWTLFFFCHQSGLTTLNALYVTFYVPIYAHSCFGFCSWRSHSIWDRGGCDLSLVFCLLIIISIRF